MNHRSQKNTIICGMKGAYSASSIQSVDTRLDIFRVRTGNSLTLPKTFQQSRSRSASRKGQ